MVTFGLKSSRSVVFSPSNMSRRRNLSVHLFFGCSTSMSRNPSRRLGGAREQEERERDDRRAGDREDDFPEPVPDAADFDGRQRQQDDAGDEDVREGQRDHPLPP